MAHSSAEHSAGGGSGGHAVAYDSLALPRRRAHTDAPPPNVHLGGATYLVVLWVLFFHFLPRIGPADAADSWLLNLLVRLLEGGCQYVGLNFLFVIAGFGILYTLTPYIDLAPSHPI